MKISYSNSTLLSRGWLSIPLLFLGILGLALSARAQEGSQGNTTIFGGAQMTFFGNHNFLTGGGGTQPGIIGTVRTAPFGVLNFASTATSHTGANDANHVDGYVRKLGTGQFIFPTGDNAHYGPFAATADGTTGAYFFVDPTSAVTSDLAGGNYSVLPTGGPFPSVTREAALSTVSTKEYWDIDGANATKITLTWSSPSAVAALTGNDLSKLTIAGWNGTQWLAIPSTVDVTSVLGGASSLTAGSITSTAAITPDTYTAYTLASYVDTHTPFGCTKYAYVVSQGTGANDPNVLSQVDLVTGVTTVLTSSYTAPSRTNINAIGYNSKDGYLWGSIAGPTDSLIRIGADLVPTRYRVIGLPTADRLNAGTFDANGVLYMKVGGSTAASQTIYKVDLDPASPTYLTLLGTITLSPSVPAFADMAYNSVDGFMYAISNASRTLYKINPATGASQALGAVTADATFNTGATLGSTFIDLQGNLYETESNSGRIYKLNTVQSIAGASTAAFFSQGQPAGSTDGTMCPFTDLTPPVTVSGQVWNDADGNLALNGSETGTNAGGPLYVNLVDANGMVVASATVSPDGSYSLTAPASTTGLKLVLTNSATASTPGTLPTGWVNTGETAGSGNTASQSSTLGVIELSTGTSPVTGSGFGIEQLPTAGSGSATASNAGGSNPVTVPSSAFTSTTASTDTAPGSVTAIRITAFPTNVTSLTVDGAVYTSLPAGGIVVPTDGSGAPTVPILVDPTNDGSPVSIPFVAVDNAGKESANTGTATLNALVVPPVASNDVASTGSGIPVTINVLSNDTPGAAPIDPTSVRLIDPATSQPVTSLTIAGEGVYEVDLATGAVTFMPLPTFSGVATAVPYTVSDVNGHVSNTALITVTVTPASTLNPDNNVTYVNLPVLGNVSTNDKVPTGTTYGTPTASAGNPAGGSLMINPDGTYRFTGTTPGSYTYTVPVCAPGQTTGCPTEPLVIDVLPYPPAVGSPAPPVALIDVASVKGDPTTPASVTIDVRANDRPETSSGTLDPPTIVSPSAHGTATVGPDGKITYTPDPGYYGDDVLTYQVCEAGTGLCTTAQEVIHVLTPNSTNSTLAADDYITTTYNTPVSGNVKGNDTDPEGNTQTVVAQTMTTAAGSLTINADGSYRFVPTPGYSGPANFPYTTCDNGTPQACASATLYILVAPALPDLTPIIFARPSTVKGTSNITYVVRVVELNGVATSGPITVRVSKDALINLTFPAGATGVGGQAVQNSAWNFSGPSGGFYTLTTNQVIPAGGELWFGLTGTLTPGATDGTLSASVVIVAGSGGEVFIDNNTDSDKIDYFQQ